MSHTFLFNPEIYEKIYREYLYFINEANQYRGSENWRGIKQIEPLTKKQLQELLEVALWSSLKQEEGRFHNFSLCVIPKEGCLQPFIFDEPIRLNENHLTKLSPAFDLSANFIGVWHGENETLEIWGFASTNESRSVELFCEVVAPGQILVSFRQYKLQHFAVFVTGLETKVVKRSEFDNWVNPEYEENKSIRNYRFSSLLVAVDFKTIVTAMRSHQHGGTLLVVKEKGEWKNSIRKPIKNLGNGYDEIKLNIYSRNQLFEEQRKKDLGEQIRLSLKNFEADTAKDKVNKSLKVIGNLTAIDGATVINSEFDVLAFGVKIDAKDKPEKVLILSPFEEVENKEEKLSDLGGTRHQSAAQFVCEQKDTLAFVASQDGRISVMKWDSEREIVCVIRPAEFALV